MTKPNDPSSFSLILPFHLLCTTIAAVCKGEHKRVQLKIYPTNRTYTALHTISKLPIFEVGISKNLKQV